VIHVKYNASSELPDFVRVRVGEKDPAITLGCVGCEQSVSIALLNESQVMRAQNAVIFNDDGVPMTLVTGNQFATVDRSATCIDRIMSNHQCPFAVQTSKLYLSLIEDS
jgi:hypothetical protein